MKKDAATVRRACMRVALGRDTADLVIQGGTLVDVNIGKTYAADVAIKGNRIAFVGDCSHTIGPETEIFSAEGKFLTPTFIDTHLHATGVQLSLTELAKSMVAHGTTVICTDLYEAAILGGIEGMRFCLDELNSTPLKTLITIGYQMYIQNRDLGNTEKISAEDMMAVLDWPETIGISEWLLWFWSTPEDHPPVVQELFEEVWARGMQLVGHAHSYPTRDVAGYAAVGSSSEHEANSDEDALEKLKAGYRIQMKENGSIHNTQRIVPLITDRGIDSRHIMWNSDHTSPDFLLHHGNIDAYIREAIRCGVEPIVAVQMGSLNPAEYYRLTDDLGSVTPGRLADIVIVNNLEDFQVTEVFAEGKLVGRDGEYIAELDPPQYPEYFFNTINVGREVQPEDFIVRTSEDRSEVKARVIGLHFPITRTDLLEETLPVVNGKVQTRPEDDIIKIAVLDRHHASGNTVTGFIKGAKLARGAYGTSYHAGIEDIGIIGTNEEDIAAVANCLIEMGGGAACAVDGKIVGKVEMPLLGLMPTDSLKETVTKWDAMNQALRDQLGSTHPTPWRAVGFPCMPRAIPRLKICQAGLADVSPTNQVIVPVLIED